MKIIDNFIYNIIDNIRFLIFLILFTWNVLKISIKLVKIKKTNKNW